MISFIFFKGWVIPVSPSLALQLIVLAKEDGEDGKADLFEDTRVNIILQKKTKGMLCWCELLPKRFLCGPPRPKAVRLDVLCVLKLIQRSPMAWWPRALGEDIPFLTAPTRLGDHFIWGGLRPGSWEGASCVNRLSRQEQKLLRWFENQEEGQCGWSKVSEGWRQRWVTWPSGICWSRVYFFSSFHLSIHPLIYSINICDI